MALDTDKIKARLEKTQAAKKKLMRQAQLLTTKLGQQARKDDTRRKILAGSWALARAEKSSDFHADMHRELSRTWLVRDDDRKLFGLEPLSDAEKTAREMHSGGSPHYISSGELAKASSEAVNSGASPSFSRSREIEAA